MANPWDNDPVVAAAAAPAHAPWEADPEAGSSFSDRAESNLNASASGFANGIPIVGPYLNEGLNKAEAGIRTLWDGDKTYQQELDQVHGAETADNAANPGTHLASSIAGGVYGTAPLIMAAPTAFGAGSGPLFGRLALGAASGGAIGGGDAAVRSDGDISQTLLGIGKGAVAGAAGPVIGKAVGAGVRWARGAADDAISGISKPAQRYIESTIGNPERMQSVQADLGKLGDQAVLADVSPSWRGVARGAAAQPSMRDEIVNALINRAEGAPTRLRSDADQFMGPRVIPSQIEAGLEGGRAQFAQQYGPVMANARGVDTQPLADGLDALSANLRGPERTAVTRVRGYLDIPGETVDGQPVLDPNPQALHATRQAIDGLMTGETNPNIVRQLTAARNQVDDVLADAAPGIKDVDGRMHELYRQSQGLTQGRPILSNEAGALRPEEVQDMFVNGSLPQGRMIGPSAEAARMRDSVRGEFDRIIGTQANKATALKKTVRGEGDWNRDKLAFMYGPDNANGLLNAVDREVTFNNTTNKVTQGSDTAMTQGFSKFLEDASKPVDIPAGTTWTGLGLKAAKFAIQSALEKNAEKAAGRYASEIGSLSVAQGAQRDALVEALINRSQSIAKASDPRVQAIVNALTQTGARQILPSR